MGLFLFGRLVFLGQRLFRLGLGDVRFRLFGYAGGQHGRLRLDRLRWLRARHYISSGRLGLIGSLRNRLRARFLRLGLSALLLVGTWRGFGGTEPFSLDIAHQPIELGASGQEKQQGQSQEPNGPLAG